MHRVFWLLLVSPVAGATGPEACTDCSFRDVITGELRATSKGPSEKSYPYLQEEEDGWSIAEKYVEKFQRVELYDPKGFSDGGDPAYDEDEGGDPWWLVLLKLILAAAEYVEDLQLNGEYDGYLTVDGVDIPAYVQLSHFGSDVSGQVAVLEPVILDGGICGSYEIPAGTALRIRGTEGTATGVAVHTASGATTRRVAETWLFDVYATTSFTMSLMNDYETLTGSISLVVTDPCADPDPIVGRFKRRSVF